MPYGTKTVRRKVLRTFLSARGRRHNKKPSPKKPHSKRRDNLSPRYALIRGKTSNADWWDASVT